MKNNLNIKTWKYYYIYKITNLINNKTYIGQRKTNKSPETDSYFGSGKLIKLAIKKYGINFFNKDIIENCKNWEELNIKEKTWIKKSNSLYPNGYNICKGGRGGISCGELHPLYNKHQTTETKHKISEKLKGTKRSLESIEKQKTTNKNNPIKMPKESRQKISILKKGKKQSKEHLEALSKIRKGKPSPMKNKKHTIQAIEKNRLAHLNKIPGNAKKIDVFTKNNILIKTFNSLLELKRNMNTSTCIVVDCCNNKRETYHNLIFRWQKNII